MLRYTYIFLRHKHEGCYIFLLRRKNQGCHILLFLRHKNQVCYIFLLRCKNKGCYRYIFLPRRKNQGCYVFLFRPPRKNSMLYRKNIHLKYRLRSRTRNSYLRNNQNQKHFLLFPVGYFPEALKHWQFWTLSGYSPSADPYHWITVRIWILLFSSVTFKTPTKSRIFSFLFFAYDGTFRRCIYISLQRSHSYLWSHKTAQFKFFPIVLAKKEPDPEGWFSPLKTAPRGSGSVLIMAWTMKARIRNDDSHLWKPRREGRDLCW